MEFMKSKHRGGQGARSRQDGVVLEVAGAQQRVRDGGVAAEPGEEEEATWHEVISLLVFGGVGNGGVWNGLQRVRAGADEHQRDDGVSLKQAQWRAASRLDGCQPPASSKVCSTTMWLFPAASRRQ